MTIERPRGDRPAPLAAGAHAEDGRAAAFLFRDAKPLAATEKSRRPAVAGRRSGRSPYPRPDQVIKGRGGSAWSRQKEEDRAARHGTQQERCVGPVSVAAASLLSTVSPAKRMSRPAIRVAVCAADAAGKNAMARGASYQTRMVAQISCRIGTSAGHMRRMI